MKRILLFVSILAFCLITFFSCAGNGSEDIELPEVDKKYPYYRVEYVGDGEFVAQGNGDTILVKFAQSSQFEVFDTVVIEFEDGDLKEETGSRPYFGDSEITYHYVLENPKLVRPVESGEPTFA